MAGAVVSKRLVVALAAVVAAAGIGAGGYVLGTRGSSDDGRRGADPESAESVRLPKPDASVASGEVGAYLAGEGALFVRFRELSEPLTTLDAVAAAERTPVCQEVAARLNREVDGMRLLEVAAAIPDPLLAELAVSERTARAQALAACLGNQDFGTTLEELLLSVEATNVLVERRVGQL